MPVETYTKYEMDLYGRIVANDCTESTAAQYIRTLRMFNGDAAFRNLGFLRTFAMIDAFNTSKYAPSTQGGNFNVFLAVMRLEKLNEKATYKKAFAFYEAASKAASEVRKKEEIEGKPMTEKEKEAFIPWPEVVAIQAKLQAKVAPIVGYKTVTIPQYEELRRFTLLSCYVIIPPRRSKDYHEMYVVHKWDESMDETGNFYCYTSKRFILGSYKSAKTYGRVINAVPEPLQVILQGFIKHHPALKGTVDESTPPTRLYINYDGTFNDSTNFVTRELNKVFHPKKISVGALRHIYDNSRMCLSDMIADAAAMGHSLNAQRTYLRTDTGLSAGAGAGAGAAYVPRAEPAGVGAGAGARAAVVEDDGTAAGGAGV